MTNRTLEIILKRGGLVSIIPFSDILEVPAMKLVGSIFLLSALILPPLLDYAAFSLLDLTFLVRICGLTGFTLMSLQFILTSRLPFMEAAFGRKLLIGLHRKSGAAAWGVLCVHGLVSLGLKNAREGGLTFSMPYDLPVAGGMVSLVLLTMIVLTAVYRKVLKISYQTWKRIHRISFFLYPLLFIHALILGSTLLAVTAVKIQWFLMFALVLGSWIWKVMLYSRSQPKGNSP